MANGRAGRPDVRGNSRTRHRRKLYLLLTFGRPVVWTVETDEFGDLSPADPLDHTAWVAQCHECSTLVTYQTMMVDRIKLGIDGGRYTRDNIQIHCPTCSHRQGQTVMRQRIAQ